MTDQVLDILKLVLLGLLYLFFARVLWAVWSEVKSNRTAPHVDVDEHAETVLGASPQQAGRFRRNRGGDGAVAVAVPEGAGRRGRSGRGGQVARLVVVEPKSRKGATFPLGQEITIGRDPSATITIDDDTFVSQHHARIYDVEGQAMVEDLGSTNGSFHNGNRLTGARLLHRGDRVQFGYTVLEAQ